MGSDGEWALDAEKGEYVWNGEEWDGEGAWCEKPEQPEVVSLAGKMVNRDGHKMSTRWGALVVALRMIRIFR